MFELFGAWGRGAAVVCCLAMAGRACGGGEGIPFDAEHWILANARVTEHMGRTCLQGTATLKDVEFGDGVIEVDIAMDGGRAYPGLAFRIKSAAEYERFYLRPHRAGLYTDAAQYAPVFNGVCCWQLYHGAGFTSGVDLPTGEWVHLRMEVSGEQARVYLGEGEAPVLAIDKLKHGASRGMAGIMDPEARSAYFSNFRIEHGGELAFEEAAETAAEAGTITDWEVSKPFDKGQVSQEEYPHFFTVFGAEWRPVEVEASGLVNVSRLYPSSARRPQSVYARTIVRCKRPRRAELSLGYSDDVTVFLNGRAVYHGESGYRSRDPSYVGAIGYHDTAYLNLETGLNEICLLVSDSFGGWGFMGKTRPKLRAPVKAHERVEKLWETPAEFKVPESVLYDAEREVLYVSSFNRVGAGGRNEGFISRVTLEGEIAELEWVSGLDGPCGMGIHEGTLYVAECSGHVAEIDIEAGEVRRRYAAPEFDFLNDLVVDDLGRVYVTNTSRSEGALDLLRLADGKLEAWKTGYDLHRSNGLFYYEGDLIVGTVGRGMLKRVDVETGAVEEIACLGAGVVDGIRADGAGNFLVSRWEGPLYRVSPEGEVVELLDLYGEGLNCADFEFVKERGMAVIPTFLGNRVAAYRLLGE